MKCRPPTNFSPVLPVLLSPTPYTVLVRASLPSADHRASGASSSGYGQTISNDRRRSRDHVSDSVLDEDEDNEDDYADMDLEGGGEGDEEEDVEGRRSTSVSDVQRQGREERRAVDAVRAAAGLGALTERERDREPESDSFSGRSSFASSVTSDYRSDRGRERAREGLFEDGYSRLSTEPSFSLFDDRNEDSDGESSSRRYRSSGIRLNMDSDAGEGSRDSTAIEGVRISSGSGDLRARSSSGSGSGGTIDRQYSSASASGNPFAASRSQRSSSLASAGLGRDRSSTSSSRELDFGREGEAGISGGEEFFPDGFISDPRVRIVRSPLVSDPGTLHWDNLPDRDSSGGALSGLSGSIDEIGRTGLGGSGVTSNSSSAAIESLYGAVHANLPTEQR